MNVVSISVTERGRRLAAQLPYDHVHGSAAEAIRKRWTEVDGFVLFLATGAAVRIVAPLLADKRTDPAIVCVDEGGHWAVALTGGHERGANELAGAVAARLGAEPVVTTATDAVGVDVPDEATSGAIVRRLDGTALLVAGVGASSGAPADEIAALLDGALADAGLDRADVAEVATIDLKADEPGIVALGLPLRTYPAERLRTVEVPTPSAVVDGAVGTPSVAEAGALLAAGPGGDLIVAKRTSPHATVAVARRARRRGRLTLVGLGPGHAAHRTPAAAAAVRTAQVVIGYGPYVDQCADLLGPRTEAIRSSIGDEVVRAKQALAEAESGHRVAVVCSGDAGVYAMASIVLELAGDDLDADVEVIPGVTAALAAAAALGAPLGHDHVSISLSDLLTPWPTIERRVTAAAEADLVVALYNPRSKGRTWQLDAARRILLAHRPATTPVGIVTDAARPGQRMVRTTLAALDPDDVGMTTCVVVGSSTTRLVGGRMVTPRGYAP